MSLRDYLDAAEALAPTDLHHAITRAAIYGGSLDTALLELGLVDPHGLEAILAAAHGLPTTPPELLAPRRRPWERLAPRWIEERLAAPLAALDDRLWIAVHPDLPSDALAQLWQEESALEVTVTAECCLRRVLAEQTGEALSARHAVLAATYLRTLRPPTAAASPFVDDDASPPPRADAPADDAGAAAPHASTDDAFPHADTASSEPAGDAASPPRAGEDADIAEAAPPAPPPEIRTFIPSTLRHAVPFPETPAPDDSDSARDPQIPALLAPRSPASPEPTTEAPAAAVPTPEPPAPEPAPAPDALLPPLLRSRGAAHHASDAPSEGSNVHVHSDMSLDLPAPPSPVPGDIPATAATPGAPARTQTPPDAADTPSAHESALFPRLLRARAADALSVTNREPSAPSPAAAREPSAPSPAAAREPSAPSPAAAREPSAPSPTAAPSILAARDEDAILPRLVRPRSTEPPVAPAHLEAPDAASLAPATPPPTLHPSPAAALTGHATPPVEPALDAATRVAAVSAAAPHEREEDAVLPRLVRARSGGFLPASLVHREAADAASRPDLDALIDAALAPDARVDAHASELRGRGPAALARLAQRFPGPQEPLRGDLRHLAPPSAQSPFLRLCIAIGDELVPYILDRLAEPDPLVRFYGALVFQELRSAAAAPALAGLAFDDDADVRTMAIRVLETYGRAPTYPRAIQRLRGELASESSERRRMAITALGTVRDVASLPRLIDILADPEPQTRSAAIASLCSITGQHFGAADARWRAWYADNGERHRIDWMLDSLGHGDVAVRRWAADELMRITGQRFPFPAAGEPAERAAAIDRWRAWWQAFQSRILG